MFNGKGYYTKNNIAFQIFDCKNNSNNIRIRKFKTKSQKQCIKLVSNNNVNTIKKTKNVKDNTNVYKRTIINGIPKNNIYRTSTNKIYKIFKNKKSYENEIKYHKLAAEHKIAPRLFEYLCGEYTYYNPEVNKQTKVFIISMEAMRYTLEEFMNKRIPVCDKFEVQRQCYVLLEKMKNLGIKHRDLHDRNIMINYYRKDNKSRIQVRFIDFGYSEISFTENILPEGFLYRTPLVPSGNRVNSKNLEYLFHNLYANTFGLLPDK